MQNHEPYSGLHKIGEITHARGRCSRSTLRQLILSPPFSSPGQRVCVCVGVCVGEKSRGWWDLTSEGIGRPVDRWETFGKRESIALTISNKNSMEVAKVIVSRYRHYCIAKLCNIIINWIDIIPFRRAIFFFFFHNYGLISQIDKIENCERN